VNIEMDPVVAVASERHKFEHQLRPKVTSLHNHHLVSSHAFECRERIYGMVRMSVLTYRDITLMNGK
jgi:hypothetical protein